ncbi:MAG: hypothetical protein GDA38_20250 [Hormoscilla sp. SP12CHS1]|nr:hypothetical protein [Hormoscilla sp. SP12CHS1]
MFYLFPEQAVINYHKQDDIVETLAELDLDVPQGVTEVSIDMWGSYTLVVEKFSQMRK